MPDPAAAIELEPLDEEEDEDGVYAVNPEHAKLEAASPGGAAGEVRSFAGPVGQILLSKAHRLVTCVAYSPDNVHAMAGMDRTVHVLHVKSGKRAYHLEVHREEICSGAFSADGNLALAGDAIGNLLLWEVATARPLRWLDAHRRAVDAVAFAPRGPYAVFADRAGRINLWDVNEGEVIQRFGEQGLGVTSLAYSPDGQYVVCGMAQGRVAVWDVTTGAYAASLRCHGNVEAVTFAEDPTRVVAAGLGKLLGVTPFDAWHWTFPGLSRCRDKKTPPERMRPFRAWRWCPTGAGW